MRHILKWLTDGDYRWCCRMEQQISGYGMDWLKYVIVVTVVMELAMVVVAVMSFCLWLYY